MCGRLGTVEIALNELIFSSMAGVVGETATGLRIVELEKLRMGVYGSGDALYMRSSANVIAVPIPIPFPFSIVDNVDVLDSVRREEANERLTLSAVLR